jgi:hypothetical protein
MLQGEYSSQNSGHFRRAAMQATIEGDLDVYTSFVKLLGPSSRDFTAWRPDSVTMKIGAISEVTAIHRADLRHRPVALVGLLLAPDYRRDCAGGCDWVDRSTESQPTWRGAALLRR